MSAAALRELYPNLRCCDQEVHDPTLAHSGIGVPYLSYRVSGSLRVSRAAVNCKSARSLSAQKSFFPQ